MNGSWQGRSGLKLAVAEHGDGKTMVFQHGLCGDASQPAQVFPDRIGWRCLSLECRGHGQSEAGSPDDFSIAAFTDDLADVIERRIIKPASLEKPVIGGISMGAAIALRLAVTRPELVGGLVLARPAWLTAPAPENMRANALVGQLLRDHPSPEARARFEASAMAAQLRVTGPDNLVSLRGFFARAPQTITAELLCRISADGPGVSEDDVRRIGVPTLVIGHDLDAVHPLAFARTLATWIPQARLVQITPKALDPQAYQHDFRTALIGFLRVLG